ncbi:hypothetical protein CDAR_297311 [Caerostris darwini]|uniref:Uncharacterized protein n=1 Tax=Caerostris darwini TaxID=1538125 RepID=A0AAV4PTC7_9ARAC|nr:hypothetical protein CDAR_297311 [Caerostris darwini]
MGCGSNHWTGWSTPSIPDSVILSYVCVGLAESFGAFSIALFSGLNKVGGTRHSISLSSFSRFSFQEKALSRSAGVSGAMGGVRGLTFMGCGSNHWTGRSTPSIPDSVILSYVFRLSGKFWSVQKCVIFRDE